MKNVKILIAVLPMLLFIACDKENRKSHEDEVEREIKISELPKAVVNAIEVQFPGAILKEADEITQKGGELTYDVEIEHKSSKMEVMYSSRGEYLGTEVDDDDSDDDDNDDDHN